MTRYYDADRPERPVHREGARRGSQIGRVRRQAYGVARFLGDVQAVLSGSPSRVGKRLANKWVGRKVVRRMWFK